MTNNISNRSLLPRWNTSERRNDLLDAVRKGNYDTDFVIELLNLKHFEFFPYKIKTTQISVEQILELRNRVSNVLVICSNNKKLSYDRNMVIWSTYNETIYSEVLNIFNLNLYEASKASIWNYLTWYALLDLAVLDFPPGTERQIQQRFDFNRSRHVYARWWWRAETTSNSDLFKGKFLLESEWELIFERQNLIWNPKVASALASVIAKFRDSKDFDVREYSSGFEKEWIKSVLRLTSQSTFDAFTEKQLYERFYKQLVSFKTK